MIQEIVLMKSHEVGEDVVDSRTQLELLAEINDVRGAAIRAAIDDLDYLFGVASISYEGLQIAIARGHEMLGSDLNKCSFIGVNIEAIAIVAVANLQDNLRSHGHSGYPELDIFLERFR